MVDKTIIDLTELNETPANGDVVEVIDTSDTTDGVTGTSKKLTIANLLAGVTALITGKADAVHTHLKADVGLGNVDNTSDADKPISTAQGAKNTAQDALISDNTAKNSYPSADSTKLAGIESNATADQTGVEIKTAYESEADTNAFTDAEKTKLGTVATNAEVNQTTEQLQDLVAAMFQGGTHTNASISYDDGTGTISITATGGGGGGSSLTQEEVEDFVGGLTTAGTGISVNYDDAGNVLTVSLTGESYTTAERNKVTNVPNDTNAALAAKADATSITNFETTTQLNTRDTNNRNRTNHTGTQTLSTISDAGDRASQDDGDDVDAGEVVFVTATAQELDLGTLGATENIDLATATTFIGVLDQNCTITFANEVVGKQSTVLLTGDFLPTFSDVDEWGGGTAPVALTGGETLIVTVVRIGATIYGSYQTFS